MSDFFKNAYLDENGIWRWKSNDHIPFDDMLLENGIDASTRQKCTLQRDNELADFLKQYQKSQDAFWDPQNPEFAEARTEQLYEMRAAFGKGATVVNAFTGRKHIL